MVDVHSDQRAYLQHPDPRTPPPGPRGGIRAAIPAPGVLAIEVRKIAAEASFESPDPAILHPGQPVDVSLAP
jgi:hypothetical protein